MFTEASCRRLRRSALLITVVLAAGAGPATQPGRPDAGVAALAGQAPVKLILDVDMDSDCDDAGALGLLHALADRDEVEILAVTTSALNVYSGPCVDAINTYYGRPDIPIGTARAPAPDQASKYAQRVAEKGKYDLPKGVAAPDAVEVYQRVLAAQADGSVTTLARAATKPCRLVLGAVVSGAGAGGGTTSGGGGPVPEPGSIFLLGTVLLGVTGICRTRLARR
jgi:hypothetical protein